MEAPPYARQALHQRTIWASLYGQVVFKYAIGEDGCVELHDTRPLAAEEHVKLSPLESAVFVACERISTRFSIQRAVREFGLEDAADDEIDRTIEDLERRAILLGEDEHWLAIANRDPEAAHVPFLVGGVSKSYLWRQIEGLKEPPKTEDRA
jgi:hypothetical protein